MAKKKQSGWRGSKGFWLEGAYKMLVTSGVDSIKVMALAEMLNISRTSFYWHFKDRKALLDSLIACWKEKNTGNLIAQTQIDAKTITEAMLNLFDCWINPDLFDSPMDFAIRNWAHNSPELKSILDQTDQKRLMAIQSMFLRFNFDEHQANIRAHAIYYTQVGYISMMVKEQTSDRIAKMPAYIEAFAGLPPTKSELARFRDRHLGELKG